MSAPETTQQRNNTNTRPQRTQKCPPESNMIYNGKLCTMYSDHTNKSLIVVLPKQNCANITDMYPVDIAYLFNEVKLFCEHYRIRNYTVRVHRRDWNYSLHMHLQVTMPRIAYECLSKAIGFQSESGKQGSPPTLQPRPPPKTPKSSPAPNPPEAVPHPEPDPPCPCDPCPSTSCDPCPSTCCDQDGNGSENSPASADA